MPNSSTIRGRSPQPYPAIWRAGLAGWVAHSLPLLSNKWACHRVLGYSSIHCDSAMDNLEMGGNPYYTHIDPPTFSMQRRRISIESTSFRGVTVWILVILGVSLTTNLTSRIFNPQYLALMIFTFSSLPCSKLSSLLPRLNKWIIHNTSLIVLRQSLSLDVKESVLFSRYIHP